MPMVVRHEGLRRLARRIARPIRDEAGVTALEYGLLTALIALVIAGALTMFSSDANQMFTHIASTI